VGAAGPPGGVGREGEPVRPQDAQHPLGIDARLAARVQCPVHQCGDAAIAVARAGIDDRADCRQQLRILGLAVGTARLGGAAQALGQVGAGHAERVGDRLHREPPVEPPQELSGEVGFFVRARSSASFRISTSMVLRPSRRSRSRTRRSNSRTRLVPTTSSSACTA